MRYHTLLLRMAGQSCFHYVLHPSNTWCGESLDGAQFEMIYDLDEEKLCQKCEQKEPVPSIKDWSNTNRIRKRRHASLKLDLLYIFYQMLDEELQIGAGIYEFGKYGVNDLTNYLINDQPKVEAIKESEVLLSYRFKTDREERTVSFWKIEKFMKLIKDDLLFQFQIMKN